jgi:hypothetical protein
MVTAFLVVNTSSRNAIKVITIKKIDMISLSFAFMIGISIYFQENTLMICKFRLTVSNMISQKAVELFLCLKEIFEVIRAKINPTITPINAISKSVCGPQKSANHLPECKIQAMVTMLIKKVKLKNAFIFFPPFK